MIRTIVSRLLPITILLSLPIFAQQDRIRGPIDSSQLVKLSGNVSPNIRQARDLGRMAPSARISYVTLGLQRTPEQQAELNRLLDELQNPRSPKYHQWLSPEEFGQRFGASANDIAQISAWLRSQGLTVEDTSRSKNWIIFSGTASQIEQAFHTELHHYEVNGEQHFSIASEPSIPAALGPVVLEFRGLNDFRAKPAARHHYNPPGGDPVMHALAPGDIDTIYDLQQLHAPGIDGTGQKLAIVSASEIYMDDLQMFRQQTGLPPAQAQSVFYGTHPGINGAQDEADIDIQWAGAAAPNATLIFVQGEDPFVALQYAIDQNLAPVISVSYAACEAQASGFAPEITEAVAQQANAQGITILVASGDQASAACDRTSSGMPAVATMGASVNFPSSLPEVTAVGGTMFNEGDGTYWAPQNNAIFASALTYIPEVAWNETTVDGSISGSTGGPSVLFPKPAWQAGPGVPNDGARDIPDISLASAANHDPYVIFTNDGQLSYVGGTSVATPVLAGMMALLNQYLISKGIQSQPGLGNINPTLYQLAQSVPKAFHDITQGDNIVPCSGGNGCSGGFMGYSTGPGYDLVTGWGSVDAAQLIANWTTPAETSGVTITTVFATPSSLTVADTTDITATVVASLGVTPTGSVSFLFGNTTLGTVPLAGGTNTSVATLRVYGSQLPVGSDVITAVYSGNLNGSSGSVTLNVTEPVASAAVIPSFAPNPVYQQKTDSDGYSWFFTVTLTETNGVAATLTGFTFAGNDYSSSIPDFFGSSSIDAYGTLQGALRAKMDKAPASVVLGFNGVDANGHNWSQQISVPFYPRQTTASIALSSSPDTVREDPSSSDCPYLEQINIQEQNGYEVLFTHFTADGADYTDHIQDFFGSLRLAPFGALEAEICWTGITPPQTIQYEIDGTDTNGNKVVATGSAVFQGPVSNPGTLSVSSNGLTLSATDSSGSANATVNIDVPAGEAWSLAEIPANRQTSWLVVTPLSGTGPAQVTITASGAGLASGSYAADLAFQSTNTQPQYVNLPVEFTIGESPDVSISSVANGASFQNDASAPGSVLTVFGSNLAPATMIATALPLPMSLEGVTATVDGVPAPFYFVSSGQLNIQVPYETPAGPALLAVNNNGAVGTWWFDVSYSAPGIFTDANNNMVPFAGGSRGQTYVMFVTGEGDVTPALATGATPILGSGTPDFPKPVLDAVLSIGSIPAKIAFIGVPPGLAGVTQVNFTVPSDAPLGEQPVELTIGNDIVGHVTSPAANFTVK